MRIDKKINALQEVGALINEQLRQHLASYTCGPSNHALGLWKEDGNSMLLTLMLDESGVGCLTKESTEHFIDVLKARYEDM